MKNIIKLTFIAFSLAICLPSCKKHTNSENRLNPTEGAHFLFKKTRRCFIGSTDDSFKVKIGLTNPSTSVRTVTLSATSSTAKEGIDYVISKKTFTIKPGQVLDSFYIKAANATAVANYIAGRSDSLLLTFIQPGVPASEANPTRLVQLTGPCDPNNFKITDLDFLLGEFDNTSDNAGSPYIAEFKSYDITSPTTATLTFGGIQEFNGDWDVKFIMDYSTPGSYTLTPITSFDKNSSLSASQPGRFMQAIYAGAAGVGSFSPCTPEFNLLYTSGYFDNNTSKYTAFGVVNTVLQLQPE